MPRARRTHALLSPGRGSWGHVSMSKLGLDLSFIISLHSSELQRKEEASRSRLRLLSSSRAGTLHHRCLHGFLQHLQMDCLCRSPAEGMGHGRCLHPGPGSPPASLRKADLADTGVSLAPLLGLHYKPPRPTLVTATPKGAGLLSMEELSATTWPHAPPSRGVQIRVGDRLSATFQKALGSI